jgi:hypothetical protein
MPLFILFKKISNGLNFILIPKYFNKGEFVFKDLNIFILFLLKKLIIVIGY